MAAPIKTGYQIDARAWNIISEECQNLKKYFPLEQDQHMYLRELKKALDKAKVRINEEVSINGNGRTADNSAA